MSGIFTFFIYLFTLFNLSFVFPSFSLILSNANPIEFIVNAKPPQAINNKIIPNNLSVAVYGLISPYPIVVIVKTPQYNDVTYLIYHGEFLKSPNHESSLSSYYAVK